MTAVASILRFPESSFVRLMTSGLDPAGNKLAVAMPTYRMPQEDMANLIAYLKRIETDTDPGVNRYEHRARDRPSR